eukprot:1327953-Prymnesium_polylepis.1
MQNGDAAAWVPAGATSCTAADLEAAANTDGLSAIAVDQKATFQFPSTLGLWALCYRHNYQQLEVFEGGRANAAHILYPNVQVAVVRVDGATPALAPAVVGCVGHTVTLSGQGFSNLPAASYCNFASVGTAVVSIVSDTQLRCTAPVPSKAVASILSLVYGSSYGDSSNHPAVLSTFTFYDASSFAISSGFPVGAAYNLVTTLWLTGSFPIFASGGASSLAASSPMLCRFGDNISAVGAIVNTTLAWCPKPVFPNDAKTTQTLVVRVAPIGHCFVNSTANFSIYNAQARACERLAPCTDVRIRTVTQIDGLSISGAPVTSPITLHVYGAGFPYPMAPGPTCRFSNSSITFKTAASVLSSSLLACVTPSLVSPGRYEVQVSLNDQDVEPSLYGTLTFDAYDLSLVTLVQLSPTAVPISTTTTLTLQGAGFAEYGSATNFSLSQLVCQVGAQQIKAQLLDHANV